MHEDLPFAIEQWDAAETRIEEVLARATNAIIAQAAWQAAIEQRPGRKIWLRSGTRVIERHSGGKTEGE